MLAALCYWTGALVLASLLGWLAVVAHTKLRPTVFLDRLQQRAVLVTGCDSGFGHAAARRLDALGVPVFAGCLLPEGPGARRLAADCSSRLRVLPLDVTSDQQVDDAVATVQAALKRAPGTELWAVLNNAGIIDLGEVDMTPLNKFQQVLDVNAMGTIRVCKAFLPLLKKSKGRLINITSPIGLLPAPMLGAYCLSKSALISFTNVLRLEMKKWSVTVCSIDPYMYSCGVGDLKMLRSKFFENADKTFSDDIREAIIRQEATKDCEVWLKMCKFVAKSDISDMVDEMVVSCIGRNVQRKHIPGFLMTIFLTIYTSLPDWLKDLITQIVYKVITIIWG